MTPPSSDSGTFLSAGYTLSTHTGRTDCTGIRLRPLTLANDHTQRVFLPSTWAVEWCKESPEERLARAADFGIDPSRLEDLIQRVTAGFESEFGAWHTILDLEVARELWRDYARAEGVRLWGVGLAHDELEAMHEEMEPNHAMGAGWALLRAQTMAPGGRLLGYEVLVDGIGCFNSLESLHHPEDELYQAAGVAPGPNGLFEEHEPARALARLARERFGQNWRAWRIQQYELTE